MGSSNFFSGWNCRVNLWGPCVNVGVFGRLLRLCWYLWNPATAHSRHQSRNHDWGHCMYYSGKRRKNSLPIWYLYLTQIFLFYCIKLIQIGFMIVVILLKSSLRRPLRKKLRMRWFFDVFKVKESSFFKSDLTDPLRFLIRIFLEIPI